MSTDALGPLSACKSVELITFFCNGVLNAQTYEEATLAVANGTTMIKTVAGRKYLNKYLKAHDHTWETAKVCLAFRYVVHDA